MSILKVAVIINGCSNDDEFLLVKQIPPPKFVEEEYSSYVDSDLWDLPSAVLNPIQGENQQQPKVFIEGLESYSEKLNLSNYDVESALGEVLAQVGIRREEIGEHWILRKYVEEAEFGPGPPIHTLFILGKLVSVHENLQVLARWMSVKSCLDLLLEVKPSSDRVGPLLVTGLLADVAQSGKCKVPRSLLYQEYPPGFTIVPMRSKTAKPFSTTNIVVFAPDNITDGCGESSFVAYGDSLIMDPGCSSEWHSELTEIVAALPKKLVVFVTHHHYDHVEGLSIIQKCNPDATLLAHENTMRRIGKDDWSLGYTRISGGEVICISGQQFNVISAPGHTDGHVALLHVSTHSLIVGDHCVGQGSAILDITSGGNMKEYFQTTYNFLEISPHALIPMHGRTNLWPKHMLCGYLKNRRNRETSILKAIETGADTLLDIVARVYSDVDSRFWVPASSNVRIHVDHLNQQDKLPKEESQNLILDEIRQMRIESKKLIDVEEGDSSVNRLKRAGGEAPLRSRTMKLTFSRFNGLNPLDWISQAERYFRYHQISIVQKVEIASIHLDGIVVPWMDWYEAKHDTSSWPAFVDALMARFGPSEYEDFNGALSKLRQTGSLQEYQSEFEHLSSRAY